MPRGWIVDALGGLAAFEHLAARMPATELWSALMEVARARAGARTPARVLEQYRRDRFVRPAAVDQRTALAVDAELLTAAEGFEALELAPVAPLGAASVLAPSDQNRVLSTVRGTEVVSDPTNVLALECAERLRRDPRTTVRLATCQRVVRAQPAPDRPGFAQHFRLFALATAGREVADHALAVGALAEHVRVLLAALARLERRGYAFGPRRVDVLTTPEREAVGERLAAALSDVAPRRLPLAHPYYSGGVRFMLWVRDREGADVPIGDGGAFDWLARLTASRRHVFVASGLGAQLVPLVFRAAPA